MAINVFLKSQCLCLAICLGTQLVSPALAKCDDRPDGIPADAVASEIWKSSDLQCWTSGSLLYAQLKNPSATKSIEGPRLANVVRRINWLENKEQELAILSEPKTWNIPTDKRPQDASILVIELDESPALFDPTKSVKPTKEHEIFLAAKLAQTHGDTLRFEPQPHKNTVGYWAREKDTASWKFQCNRKGPYEIDVLQGCGNGQGGSEVALRVGDQQLAFVVEETGHFQNFIWRTIGEISLAESAEMKLELVPIRKAAGAVMDVRAIRLVPKGSERSMTPELASPKDLPMLQ